MRNLVLNLPDQIYADAERAAAAQGYEDMEAYVADLIAQDAPLSAKSLQAVEKARIDFAEEKGLSLEEVKADLAMRKEEWLRANPR